ncbi:MAG: hypothetical protein J5503_00850 [Muribaculaceae bacterium]|nr:hypothetical protein [Muribaculaceae bacterium]
MNMSIEKMLSHVYEIEGLMLVTRRLGEENTPDVITNKIQRKVRELAEMCGVEITPQPVTAQETADVSAPAAQPESESEPEAAPTTERLPEEDYDADETWQHDNGEEFKEVFTLNYEEPKHDVVDPNEVPVSEREPDEDITVEFIEAEDELVASQTPPVFNPQPTPPAFQPAEETPAAPAPVHETINDEPVPEPDPELVPEADDEPDISVEFIESDYDYLPEPEDEMPMPPVPTEFPEVEEEEPAQPLRVDEKLQRHLSKDIRKAISLNDRFRFQRELFAGSASAMNTAIEHIEMMNSYGNAELYFFSQLHWDRENEVVQDFMNIVRNHFQK